MGSIQISHVGWKLPSGVELIRDVSFAVGNGERVALVGANGVGKTTLVRIVCGDTAPTSGTVSIDGRLGIMRQLVGTAGADGGVNTVRDLLVSVSPERIRRAAMRLDTAHVHAAADPMRYAMALAEWGDAGGYDTEVLWDECAGRALDADFRHVADRPLATLSGGEQKRLALEALLRGEDDVLVLDEPDNFLDVPAKRWLDRELRSSRKTILFVSHDRELLAATSSKIVTVEAEGTWTHGAGFASYAEARAARHERLEHDRALYDDERKRLEELVAEMARRAKISDTFAPKLKAAESRLRLFIEKNERPTQARAQKIDVRFAAPAPGSGP